MLLLMAIIDCVLIVLSLYITLFFPTPWNDSSISYNLQPFILITKKAINNHIIENWVDSIDTTQKYYVFYDKNNDKLLLKEGKGKLKIGSLWFYLWTQTYWTTYHIQFEKTHPLIYETIFNNWNKIIKLKWF